MDAMLTWQSAGLVPLFDLTAAVDGARHVPAVLHRLDRNAFALTEMPSAVDLMSRIWVQRSD
ncbi:hypothetical protein CWO90_36950 [Bradyrhizobium sp. Leo121]|nr:hypothetical protein CWO90_36950 [Bradyrhizobium sp. Leo121]